MKNNPQLYRFLICLVIAVVIVVTITSCVSEKKRAQICKTCTLKSEVRDSIIERLIEVPVYTAPVPGPTLYLPSPCASLCDSLGNLKPFTIEKKHNGIKTTIKTNTVANTLDISSNLEDSTKTTAKVLQREIYHSQLDQVPARCELRHLTDWDIFWIKVGKVLTGIILGIGGFYLFKWLVKRNFKVL